MKTGTKFGQIVKNQGLPMLAEIHPQLSGPVWRQLKNNWEGFGSLDFEANWSINAVFTILQKFWATYFKSR